MTSFSLRECLNYSRKNSSPVYMCFLDTRQAFDKVWHDGLFYKLSSLTSGDDAHTPAIDANSLVAFRDMYQNVTSRVRYQGLLSGLLPVRQGTRQGGKSSPLFYLVFINGLISELKESGNGVCLYDINMSAPTVADDMVLVSYSRAGLDNMLRICTSYANKWRFLYNTNKCSVVIYNKKNLINQNEVYLVTETILVNDSYIHLGIECNSCFSTGNCIQEACLKLRGTYISVCAKGMGPERLSPITMSTIFNSTVLPKAIYGSELWNNNSSSDLLKLQITQNFCLKHMQGYLTD